MLETADTDHFEAADGRRLFTRRWLPDGTARAAVVIVHGYAEHSGRYEWTGQQLAGAGFAAHAYDLRGHGQSEGPRVLVRSFSQHLEDLRLVLQRVRDEHAGLPVFLLGHSMGGCIVALACAVDPPDVRGVVLTGPVLPNGRGGLRLRERIIGVVGRLFPRLPLVKLPADGVSRDPAVQRDYDADPLNYRGRVPAGLAASMTRAVRRIERDAANITLPLLILHGSADVLASPSGSQWLIEHVSSTDKTLKVYDGLAHEVLNEPERAEVVGDITSWLAARR
jgi:alpha-beta hydrolase superfamily lysophospholipase